MMCAFMTPVIRKDWEVYPSHGKRNKTTTGTSQKTNTNAHHQQYKSGDLRRRALGEQRSLSYHGAGPTRVDSDLSYIREEPRSYHLSVRNSRNSSRNSFNHALDESPTSSLNDRNSSSGKKNQSNTSLNKFHIRVMDKLKNVLHKKDDDKQKKTGNEESESEEKS